MAENIQTESIHAETIKVGEITDPKGKLIAALPPHVAPTTTNEQNITTAGQRRINLIWEFTQAIIAVSITFAVIFRIIEKHSKCNINKRIFFNSFNVLCSD